MRRAKYQRQKWPESLFQTPTPLLFQHFWIRIRVQQFFKFEKPCPVQTPATIIDPTVIYPCFYLRNDQTDSCYWRDWKLSPDPGPIFHKFLTPGPKVKRRILPESTPALRIPSHLWSEVAMNPECRNWLRQDSVIFFRNPCRTQSEKSVKKRTWIRSQFSILAASGDCVVISEVKPCVSFGWIDSNRSLNRIRILKFEKFSHPDPDPD